MKASKKAFDLIKVSESLKLKSYRCPAGVWTIGWGHTSNVRPFQTITNSEADEMLKDDVSFVEIGLNDLFMSTILTQGQYDALVSFAFNIGISKFRNSTLYKLCNWNPKDQSIPDQFDRWIYANKIILKGLVIRRAAEKALYLS